MAALETALTHDPYNEYTYQQLMRLQAAAGRTDAVRRTLQLLQTRLRELGVPIAASTRQLTAGLLDGTGPHPAARGPASPAPAPGTPGRAQPAGARSWEGATRRPSAGPPSQAASSRKSGHAGT
jgi:hypothetical protein